MNLTAVDAIARAVLYEGYMLYPYRPSSIKNRQRFNFGVLHPKAYCESQTGSGSCTLRTESLLEGDQSSIEVRVRFLKMVNRTVWKRVASTGFAPELEAAAHLQCEGKAFVPWQEALECEVALPVSRIKDLQKSPLKLDFAFPAKQESEPLFSSAESRTAGAPSFNVLSGVVRREEQKIEGVVQLGAEAVGPGILRIPVSIQNLTALDMPQDDSACHIQREEVLLRSIVSAHVVLHVDNGQFVSSLDPPEGLKHWVTMCRNIGLWPVLVGAEGERSLLLASPIILYDYPQIAPESPGDLFDGLEIDEILALRILTMTEAEKSEMRNGDERAKKILERTESLPMEDLIKLHGTLRELRPSREAMR